MLCLCDWRMLKRTVHSAIQSSVWIVCSCDCVQVYTRWHLSVKTVIIIFIMFLFTVNEVQEFKLFWSVVLVMLLYLEFLKLSGMINCCKCSRLLELKLIILSWSITTIMFLFTVTADKVSKLIWSDVALSCGGLERCSFHIGIHYWWEPDIITVSCVSPP